MRGSLYRGTTTNAFTKKTVGSIPSKFETVLYPQNGATRKGFGSNSFRFSGSFSENPGPGTYIDPVRTSTESLKAASDSYSRKGFGNGFVSGSERFKIENYHPYQVPGPGSYKHWELDSRSRTALSGSSFGVGSVSEHYKQRSMAVFARAVPRSKPTRHPTAPRLGPGAYNIPRTLIDSQDYKNTAAFKAQANRFFRLKCAQSPGPGQYERDMEGVKRELLCSSLGTAGEQATTANFKLPSGYKRVKVNLYDPFENVENEEKRTPGPGSYSEEHFTIKRKVVEKSAAASSMFAVHEILDRFGCPQFQPPNGLLKATPGPAQYFAPNRSQDGFEGAGQSQSESAGKEGGLRPSAQFKSQVPRVHNPSRPRIPGPAFYKVKSEFKRESKNINPDREWI